jgi:acetyl-CoA carboxylase biotin carboxyl carrier protein
MKEITATMAGTIINVLVSLGDQITSGQDVMILESMKMEVLVTAEITGKVAEVKVQIGDFVNEGDIVLTLE